MEIGTGEREEEGEREREREREGENQQERFQGEIETDQTIDFMIEKKEKKKKKKKKENIMMEEDLLIMNEEEELIIKSPIINNQWVEEQKGEEENKEEEIVNNNENKEEERGREESFDLDADLQSSNFNNTINHKFTVQTPIITQEQEKEEGNGQREEEHQLFVNSNKSNTQYVNDGIEESSMDLGNNEDELIEESVISPNPDIDTGIENSIEL